MIRQAISCDICGAEKKQTNHWFVAHVHGGELRLTAWNVNSRLRSDSKHLCGQTCLHKLVDDFIAATLTNRNQAPQPEGTREPAVAAGAESRRAAFDSSLLSKSAYASPESSPLDSCAPELVAHPAPALPAPVVAIARARDLEEPYPFTTASLADTRPDYGSRKWRAEAWERERERQRKAALTGRRKSL